jgi:hypothetical protein
MNVSVELDPDVALVLFELLASGQILAEQLKLEVPERNSLWALQAALEKQLTAPLEPDYKMQLRAARQSIVERLGA